MTPARAIELLGEIQEPGLLPPGALPRWRAEAGGYRADVAPIGWVFIRVTGAHRAIDVAVPAHEPNAAKTLVERAWQAYRDLGGGGGGGGEVGRC